jgi:hypothetical protein
MRLIKPGFFANDTLAELDPFARLLFAGLWTIADREGRLEDRPKRIKAEVLPYDDADVDCLLQALHDSGFILRYAHGESRYIQVVNFSKHQTPHVKEVASTIQAPCLHSASTVLTLVEHSNSTADTDTDTLTETETDNRGAEAPESEAADAPIGREPVSLPTSSKKQTPDLAEDSDAYRLALYLRDAIRAHKSDARVPTTRKQLIAWAHVLDLMLREDKRQPHAVEEIIDWATRHQFWQSVILSPGKLREKYDQIDVQRRNGNGRKSRAVPSAPIPVDDADDALSAKAQRDMAFYAAAVGEE